MLQVRKVRVGDVKLETVLNRRIPPNPCDADKPPPMPVADEGVLMKATTSDGGRRAEEGARSGDWASLHMNLPVNQAVAPGAELVMAVTDTPSPAESNTFVGMLGNVPVDGFVGIPPEGDDGSEFSFTLKPSDQMGADEFRVTFQGYQAHRFIRALLYWWLLGLQK